MWKDEFKLPTVCLLSFLRFLRRLTHNLYLSLSLHSFIHILNLHRSPVHLSPATHAFHGFLDFSRFRSLYPLFVVVDPPFGTISPPGLVFFNKVVGI
ncbi:unnamed protein product [Citrullus colocynthis]|uniref:Uncharacterized protein n=1 Tax=Citrullus colocynthis TaxID=252529 RepID=A0ABP0XMS4_9ROSI